MYHFLPSPPPYLTFSLCIQRGDKVNPAAKEVTENLFRGLWFCHAPSHGDNPLKLDSRAVQLKKSSVVWCVVWRQVLPLFPRELVSGLKSLISTDLVIVFSLEVAAQEKERGIFNSSSPNFSSCTWLLMSLALFFYLPHKYTTGVPTSFHTPSFFCWDVWLKGSATLSKSVTIG